MKKREQETKTGQLVRKAENHPFLSKVILAAKAVVGTGVVISAVVGIIALLPSCPRANSDLTEAKSLVMGTIADAKGGITITAVRNYDLANTGEPKERWVEFTALDGSAAVAFFSLRGSNPSPLFYERGFGIRHGLLQYDQKRYFAVARNDGSGNYMHLRIFSLDDAGQLTMEFEEASHFYQGEMYVREGKLLVVGDNRRFKIERIKNKLELTPYLARLKYPDYGFSTHVLSYEVDENEKLTIRFDGQKIEFKQDAGNPRRLDNVEPLKIRRGETIVLDDNVTRETQIGTLVHHDEGEFRPGFYTSILPKKKALTITARDNYERFYDIAVEVDDL